MKEVFENYIENSFDGGSQAVFKFKEFEHNYRKFFPVEKDSHVLDIGVGRGEMLSCFRDWGYHNNLGIDISQSCIDFCKNLKLNCQLVSSASSYLKENKAKFQLITMLDVLEHIPKNELVSTLTDIFAALAPGGVLIVQVPNLQAPDSNLHMYNDITHVNGFVEHSLRQVLLSAGFSKLHFNGYEHLIEKKIKVYFLKIMRKLYWQVCRLQRRVTGNLNPEIMNPVFLCIAKK